MIHNTTYTTEIGEWECSGVWDATDGGFTNLRAVFVANQGEEPKEGECGGVFIDTDGQAFDVPSEASIEAKLFAENIN